MRRLTLNIEGLTFSVSPDLCESLNGELRLIKVGFGNKSRTYIDTVLVALHRAALLRGIAVFPGNVTYLSVPKGVEIKSRFSYEEMAVTLADAARKISVAWPRVRRIPPQSGADSLNRLHRGIGLGQKQRF